MTPEPALKAFWSLPPQELFARLESGPAGLGVHQARIRLHELTPRLKERHRGVAIAFTLLAQFRSPIQWILMAAAVLSGFLGDRTDALIIWVIIGLSGLLGFWQEWSAQDAVSKLLALVKTRATVLRAGHEQEVPAESVVPGDLVLLAAGASVPGDCRILASDDLYVNEAPLTGETFPVEKAPGLLEAETPLAGRTNALFMGTHVISGSAKALVVAVGDATEFGHISQRLQAPPPLTEFERGITRFGYMLMELTLVLVFAIFAINVLLARPALDSLLFSLALAVGLTPQLLPAIISVNLATGARRMARAHVIVKRLAAIENFGSMNLLCADKTGTITEGVVNLEGALDLAGLQSEKLYRLAYMNAHFETGFADPIDDAIRRHEPLDVSDCAKLDEVPYDFIRKRLSVLVEQRGEKLLITKGALENVLAICTQAERPDGTRVAIAEQRDAIEATFREKSEQGYRTLGLAYRPMPEGPPANASCEHDMIFLGYLLFFDPPKPGVVETVQALREQGVQLKVVTGDNRHVAAQVCAHMGLDRRQVLTGEELHHLSDEALAARIAQVDVFAEVEPHHKERIIRAAQRAGNVVGFLGDGINDGPALHAADVGISVDTAVDIAKEAADIVLLRKDLGILIQGVRVGRTTFANTLKYIFMATSANFGNMFSMAGASLFLPFLPLLPTQILLTNLLTDLPEMTIAVDAVDRELVDAPQRWNMRFIARFMTVFGLVSSIFDYLTFALLYFLAHAQAPLFRTGWFLESVCSAALIVLVVRTRAPFFRSRPAPALFWTTIGVVAATWALPHTRLGPLFGFVDPPLWLMGAIALIVALYVLTAELVKHFFYRQIPLSGRVGERRR